MPLTLYNTLTRTKEEFKPLDPAHVRMYVCGITPYDEPHIGNARVMVVFDVLHRLLRHVYGAEAVTYASNFTDIDDKIINRAKERGMEPTALADEVIASFHASMKALNVLPPTEEPRVSQYMGGIVTMVDALIAKGFAYVTPSGDVMYRAAKFPDFGKLANRDLEGQQAGARVAEDSEKEHAHDFVLWKANAKSATKLEQAFAPADYGARHFAAEGRPGWHIECSVMSEALLHTPFAKEGDTALFDIHGGGEDLQFPHHSCEIAQSEALHPQHKMANYWLHNAFITVGGKRMGKSEGNFTTIKDALAKYSPEAIRLWLLQTHYRKPVDFSEQALQACEKRIAKLQRKAAEQGGTDAPPAKFMEALLDDLNTAKALSFLEANPSSLPAMMGVLGLKVK
ncbi:MAG: cysteine--tRNA ligase [Pseudomonadaceae bacterium]|nr:cysteine--tRNA ligase [Pseudomonadaceae bacterium]